MILLSTAMLASLFAGQGVQSDVVVDRYLTLVEQESATSADRSDIKKYLRGKDVEVIVDYVKSPSLRVRAEIAFLLSTFPKDDAMDLVLTLIKDPDQVVKDAALSSLHILDQFVCDAICVRYIWSDSEMLNWLGAKHLSPNANSLDIDIDRLCYLFEKRPDDKIFLEAAAKQPAFVKNTNALRLFVAPFRDESRLDEETVKAVIVGLSDNSAGFAREMLNVYARKMTSSSIRDLALDALKKWDKLFGREDLTDGWPGELSYTIT